MSIEMKAAMVKYWFMSWAISIQHTPSANHSTEKVASLAQATNTSVENAMSIAIGRAPAEKYAAKCAKASQRAAKKDKKAAANELQQAAAQSSPDNNSRLLYKQLQLLGYKKKRGPSSIASCCRQPEDLMVLLLKMPSRGKI